MRSRFLFLLPAVLIMAVVSCSKETVEETLSVDKQLVKFSFDDTVEQTIEVTSNGNWNVNVSSQCSWIKVTPVSGSAPKGTFAVSVDKNDGVSRHGTINVVMTAGTSKSIVVNQAGYEETIAIDGSTSVELSGNGESKTVKILSDSEWTASTDASWLTVDPASGTKDATVTISAALVSETRKATVTFTTKSGNRAELSVTQNAYPLVERECAVMIGEKFTDLSLQSKGIYEGEVSIPATGTFYIQMGTRLYGFATSCGAGGLGTATKELAAKSGLPFDLLPATSKAVFKADKSKGVMKTDGNPFWLNCQATGKMKVRVDAISASDPRYMLYKVNEDPTVVMEDNFDLLLGEGSYAIAMNTYQTPADEFAVASAFGEWNVVTAKYTTGAFNGYFYDGGVTTAGKCIQKSLLEEFEVDEWVGTTSSFYQYQFQCLHIGGSSKPAAVYSPYFNLTSSSDVEVTLDLFRMASGTTADINIAVNGSGQITKGSTTVDYITYGGAPATKDWGLTSPVTAVALPDDDYFKHTIDWSGCGKANDSVDKPISHMVFTISGAGADTRLYINSGSASARVQIHGFKVVKK